jgi:ribosomal protein S12 methylthiotransferase accessory factor
VIHRLIDERTGIVPTFRTGLLADGLFDAAAVLCETAHFGLASGAPAASGTSWTDSAAAGRAALGEAVERYCGHLVQTEQLQWGSHLELEGRGRDAVDPATLALYRPGQLARPGFPFAGIGPRERIAWVEATDRARRPVLVPASLVWLAPARHSAGPDGRQLHLPVNAGIAAGSTLDEARRAALLEVLERHSLAQAWHAGATFPAVSARAGATGDGAELRVVPNRFGLPVALALRRHADGTVACGCGAATTWGAAAAKAVAEAAVSAATTALVAAGPTPWARPSGPLAPHRADRRYLRSYRPDLSDATDVTCHLQLLLDPEMTAAVESRLGEPSPGRPRASPPADTDVPWLEAALEKAGFRPLTVDLTTPDVAACGMVVARVVVPGMRATGPAAFPFLGDGLDPLPARPCLLPVPHV